MLKPYIHLSPKPGGGLSVVLGTLGFALICLTNYYIVIKRTKRGDKTQKLEGYLNFHIFCGILGPTLIVFHSDFQVRGLVAISFWSMIIVAISGAIGRYTYLQVLRRRSELEKTLKAYEQGFEQYVKTNKRGLTAQIMSELKTKVLELAAVKSFAQATEPIAPFETLLLSIWGDLRLFLITPGSHAGLPAPIADGLKKYAQMHRQRLTAEAFKRLLGYWHSFHVPFAIFMYVVALIHIVVALLFWV